MLTAARSLSTTARTNGAWTLAQGRAITLKPRENGHIRIMRGSVWATLEGPHEGLESGPLGDLHLQAGSRLSLRAGQQIVLEPFDVNSCDPRPQPATEFDWVPDPVSSAVDSWEASVAQPADDLGRALSEARRAFARLMKGVLTWSGERLTPHRPAPLMCDAASQPPHEA